MPCRDPGRRRGHPAYRASDVAFDCFDSYNAHSLNQSVNLLSARPVFLYCFSCLLWRSRRVSSVVMCTLCVRLPVCLLVRQPVDAKRPILTTFSCTLPAAVARYSSDCAAICYVLPVLWVDDVIFF